MDRDELRKEVLDSSSRNVLCEFPTGTGKSKIALDFMASRLKGLKEPSILIVVPKLVLIEGWKEEFRKWKYSSWLKYVTFVTYISFPKKEGKWSMIIFDEVHHLTERCQNAVFNFDIDYSLLLSATVGKVKRDELDLCFKNLQTYYLSARKAIQEELLPDPKVLLIPLRLDNSVPNQEIVKNKSKGNPITIPYKNKFAYNKVVNRRIIIRCTQQQWYNECSSLIEWYKRKSGVKFYMEQYLRKCGERLKWLSEQKTGFVKGILKELDNHRTLTFCCSIAQTEELGKYCINSKNKKASEYLEAFNNNKIKHITACNMIDEGCNLFDCKIGVYAMLNSSDRIVKQRLGRLLRHPEPVVIIPYYMNTRDEEIVRKMMQDYNPALVKTINNINDLRNEICN